jgi:enterochelin esterase-like enzyme
LPFVERAFPAARDPGRRFLVGFSKSGWGAFSLLLRHPDLFARAAAWDAPLMQPTPEPWNMQDVFATQDHFEQYRITALLKKRASLLRKEDRLILMGHGRFRDHVTRAHEFMAARGIRHEYVDGPQRAHRWDSGWLADAVRLLVNRPSGSLTANRSSTVLEKP